MSAPSEHEGEPVPGLPAELPEGERILWQGQPDARALARDVFKLHWIAGYFAILCALRCALVVRDQHWVEGLLALGLSLVVSLLCLGILGLMAYLQARTSLYTITTQRVVMRIGVALPVAWNLPFKRLAAAQLATRASGTGDIVLELVAPDRVAFAQFWPHTQPGRVWKAAPCLRALREPQRVAAILGDAVRQWSPANTNALEPTRAKPEPARHTHAQTVPRALLWGAFALMLGSIVLAAVSGRPGAAPQQAAQALDLRFEDRPDGALAVLDGPTERELTVLPPGSNNFVRGVLRGMFRVRKLEALDREVPFRLARDASGKLSLEDLGLARRVDLDSFGPTNSAAFRDLLELGMQHARTARSARDTLLTGLTGGQHGDYPRP